MTSPTRSPPALAGSGSFGQAGDKGLSSGPTSPTEASGQPMTEPLKDKSDEARPVRPAAMTRMSTGKQVPGGWLSAWTKDEPEVQTEVVAMGEGHAHPGPGEVGVGLERTAGILGEQERVIPAEEVGISHSWEYLS